MITVFLIALGGCDGHPQKLNILLVTVDTLRADPLNPYGYDRTKTPNIQRLADDSILFEQAFSDVRWTIPSVASVQTGTYSFTHGVRTYHHQLGDDDMTVTELLSRASPTVVADRAPAGARIGGDIGVRRTGVSDLPSCLF
jgi:hypothetical protein